jgi:hypothetical protein
MTMSLINSFDFDVKKKSSIQQRHRLLISGLPSLNPSGQLWEPSVQSLPPLLFVSWKLLPTVLLQSGLSLLWISSILSLEIDYLPLAHIRLRTSRWISRPLNARQVKVDEDLEEYLVMLEDEQLAKDLANTRQMPGKRKRVDSDEEEEVDLDFW